MKNLFLVFLLIFSTSLLAAGPATVAATDRALWPEALNSAAAFDRASRAEILVFSAALAELTEKDTIALQSLLRIKQVDMASVVRVRERLAAHLWKNWQVASASCVGTDGFCDSLRTPAELAGAGKALSLTLPAAYRNWHADTQLFHKNYAAELIRLAALFPRVSSEVDTFSPLEHDGFELQDRHFLLTFDDGPTARDGNSDALLAVLARADIHASFYMLGERLKARLQQDPAGLATIFAGQCTANHGWQHESHAKWDKWESSVTDTRDLVKATFPQQYRPWFRPPYGQRRADSAGFFDKNGLQVALWNIDSQDWNSHVSGEAAAQRVMTLMLLWRRGVVLFHDIHPKALVAVPWLLKQTRQAGVSWQDCRLY